MSFICWRWICMPLTRTASAHSKSSAVAGRIFSSTNRTGQFVSNKPDPAGFAGSGDQPRCKIGQQRRVARDAKMGIGNAGPEQPIVEFRRPLQAEQVADIKRVVERGGLIVQHDVVRSG